MNYYKKLILLLSGSLLLAIQGCKPVVIDNNIKPSENFNFVFNLYQGGDRMDSFIIDSVKPYLRDGDILVVVSGNGIEDGADLSKAAHNVTNANYRTVNVAEVNTRLATLKAALADIDIHYVVYTAGIGHIQEILAGLNEASKAQLAGITSGYEPNYLLEFTYNGQDFKYIQDAAKLIRDAGYEAGLGPSGRGLSSNQFIGWNYGQFAQRLDEMIVQTQSHLAKDARDRNLNVTNYKNVALNPLLSQMSQFPGNCRVYPQVTIGLGIEENTAEESNTNAAALAYCIQGVKAIYAAGFPGASLWFGYNAMDNMLELVKTIRTELEADKQGD